MGNAASIKNLQLSEDTLARLRVQAQLAQVTLDHQSALLKVFYSKVQDRVLKRVHRFVEQEIVTRLILFRNHVEVKAKYLFVQAISTVTIAQRFDIEVNDVLKVVLTKRKFEVYNCGPELTNVPTLTKSMDALELTDPKVIRFLLNECVWTPWNPAVSWRLKADQIFDMTIVVGVRESGVRVKKTRQVLLRIGKKWVGPHHHMNPKDNDLEEWLHRTDYEARDTPWQAHGRFYDCVHGAWTLFEQALLQIESEKNQFQDQNAIERHDKLLEMQQDPDLKPWLRFRYGVERQSHAILHNDRTFFRLAEQFELWCMQEEDKDDGYMVLKEQQWIQQQAPLWKGPIECIREYYENERMQQEDMPVLV